MSVEDRVAFCEFVVSRVSEEITLSESVRRGMFQRLMEHLSRDHKRFIIFWDRGGRVRIVLEGRMNGIRLPNGGMLINYEPFRLSLIPPVSSRVGITEEMGQDKSSELEAPHCGRCCLGEEAESISEACDEDTCPCHPEFDKFHADHLEEVIVFDPGKKFEEED